MSIEPVIGIVIVSVVLLLVVVNLLVLIRLRRNSPSQTRLEAPLERISARLELLDSMSGDLSNLSRLFLVPHIRGGVGETLLEELLHTWLPVSAYTTQYRFPDGARVDAVVRLGGFLVPIDAKFPLEQVREALSVDEKRSDRTLPAPVKRAFLTHIGAISEKYVKPGEGTMDFALMYLPSEALYYRAFVDTDGALMREAVHRGVVPVGPGGLFLYLQTVAFGLRGLGFQRDSRRALELIRQLRRDFADLSRAIDTTTTHVRNAYHQTVSLPETIRKVDADLERLAGYGDQAGDDSI